MSENKGCSIRRRVHHILILVFCGWVAILLLLHTSLPRHSTSSPNNAIVPIPHQQKHHHPTTYGARPVIGTHRIVSSSTETVHAVPPQKPVAGIALLLHGCSHSALKFFSPSPKCPDCVGLSEELRISRLLLSKGYAVIALSSHDRKTGCWGGKHDTDNVRTALDDFRSVLGKGHDTRVIAIGASSGGRFAATVAADDLADAALSMVMGLGPSLTTRLVETGSRMPKIYLAPMPRDRGTTNACRRDYDRLAQGRREEGGPSVVLDVTSCVALSVTREYLHERVPGLGEGPAEAIVRSLKKGGHLDSKSGMLVRDLTKLDWREVLKGSCGVSRSSCLEGQVLEKGVSPLAKALHRAWAFHEYCSEVVVSAVEFF